MNKKLSKTGWMLVMSLMSVTAFAQNVLTGTVYEIFDGKKEPCIGVNVAVLNTDNRLVTGVTTDYSGHYSLRIPGTEGYTLLYSFIGMVHSACDRLFEDTVLELIHKCLCLAAFPTTSFARSVCQLIPCG